MSGNALLRWGVPAGALLAVAAGWVLWRSAQLARLQEEAAAQRTALSRTWLPDRPEEAERYAADLGERRRLQEQALRTVETRLVPELRPEYQAGDLLAAQARLRADLLAVRARAERARIGLPALLPFENGLDPDPQPRALQLASLCALRLALDLCLEGGVTQVAACATGRPFADPSGAYASFPVEAEVEGPAEALQGLLHAFRDAHRLGLGLRRAELVPAQRGAPAAVGAQRLRFEATLLVRARAEWHLAPESPAAPRGDGLRKAGKP